MSQLGRGTHGAARMHCAPVADNVNAAIVGRVQLKNLGARTDVCQSEAMAGLSAWAHRILERVAKQRAGKGDDTRRLPRAGWAGEDEVRHVPLLRKH